MKLTYGELEKEWHEAVERNVQFCASLEKIIHATNHCAHSSEEASMMIYNACVIAKKALEVSQ